MTSVTKDSNKITLQQNYDYKRIRKSKQFVCELLQSLEDMIVLLYTGHTFRLSFMAFLHQSTAVYMFALRLLMALLGDMALISFEFSFLTDVEVMNILH